MKRTAYLWISILLPFLMLVACSSNEREEGKAAQQTLESAAQAFVEGFNNRDLTQFDTYFAPPDKADAAGLELTKQAAHQLVDEAAPGTIVEITKLQIVGQQMDKEHNEAMLTYRAQISLTRAEQTTFAAVVTQEVALRKTNGKWSIIGADKPEINTG